MSKLREIKKRITSVNNIAQVTRAMQLVAASRMRRMQDNAQKGRDYTDKIKEVMHRLSGVTELSSLVYIHPTLVQENNILIVVFSPKRGLAGSMPANLLRFILKTAETFKQNQMQVEFLTIGKKLRDQLVARGQNLVADFSDLPEMPTTGDIRPIIKFIDEGFIQGQYKQVILIYSKFVNAMSQSPTAKTLLPLDLKAVGLNLEEGYYDQEGSNFSFEPSPTDVMEELIPSYLETQIYQSILETVASEYSARMVAMKAASDSAKEIKTDLTLEFNKSRQAQITRELAEITAGRMA